MPCFISCVDLHLFFLLPLPLSPLPMYISTCQHSPWAFIFFLATSHISLLLTCCKPPLPTFLHLYLQYHITHHRSSLFLVATTLWPITSHLPTLFSHCPHSGISMASVQHLPWGDCQIIEGFRCIPSFSPLFCYLIGFLLPISFVAAIAGPQWSELAWPSALKGLAEPLDSLYMVAKHTIRWKVWLSYLNHLNRVLNSIKSI